MADPVEPWSGRYGAADQSSSPARSTWSERSGVTWSTTPSCAIHRRPHDDEPASGNEDRAADVRLGRAHVRDGHPQRHAGFVLRRRLAAWRRPDHRGRRAGSADGRGGRRTSRCGRRVDQTRSRAGRGRGGDRPRHPVLPRSVGRYPASRSASTRRRPSWPRRRWPPAPICSTTSGVSAPTLRWRSSRPAPACRCS